MAKPLLQVDVNRKAFPRIRSASDAFLITARDFQGPVLTRLAQLHRKQEKRIFATEGADGVQAGWDALSLDYQKKKQRLLGTPGKILVVSGDMRATFIEPTRKEYVERFIPIGKDPKIVGGTFQFGSRNVIAPYHYQRGVGVGTTTVRKSKPGTGRNRKKRKRTRPFRSKTFSIFLPRRDMVSKTAAHISAMKVAFVNWYRNERVPQIRRALSRDLKPVKTP